MTTGPRCLHPLSQRHGRPHGNRLFQQLYPSITGSLNHPDPYSIPICMHRYWVGIILSASCAEVNIIWMCSTHSVTECDRCRAGKYSDMEGLNLIIFSKMNIGKIARVWVSWYYVCFFHSRNGFVQMAYQFLYNDDIASTSFKMNVPNEIDRGLILDTMEVLQRSTEIWNGICVENTRYHAVINGSKSLQDLYDIISEQHLSDLCLSDVETDIIIHDMGNPETEYENIMIWSKMIISQPFSERITLNIGTVHYYKEKDSDNVFLFSILYYFLHWHKWNNPQFTGEELYIMFIVIAWTRKWLYIYMSIYI